MTTKPTRTPDHSIDPLFVNRWSPRAYTGEEIPDSVLEQAFEAARWAPSARNAQPWRFVYAKRHSSAWEPIFGLLHARNRLWADKASALIAVLSKASHDDGSPYVTHALDTGAAWTNFAHQAFLSGWSTRAIGGFEREQARAVFGVPDGYSVEILIAIGKQAPADTLVEEFRALETPNARKPITAFVSQGVFRAG